MMNMEWSILPGYAREEEIRELFTEYTNMVLAGDPAFAVPGPAALRGMNWPTPARKYAPPHGRLYLVCTGSTPVGCAALKALDDTRCEMKRLYVRPEYRGQGIARALVHQLMQEARVAGYRQMVLDTFPSCRRPSLFISGRASTRSSGTMITPCPARCTSAVSCKGRFDRKNQIKNQSHNIEAAPCCPGAASGILVWLF